MMNAAFNDWRLTVECYVVRVSTTAESSVSLQYQ